MPTFNEGVNHGHMPSGRWAEVQKNPNSPGAPFMLERICRNSPHPSKLVSEAKMSLLWHTQAVKHVDWYLRNKGADFNENDFLKDVLLNDDGVRGAIKRRVEVQSTGIFSLTFPLEQKHYSKEDARLSWGGIDNFDIEVDFDRKTLHAWFKDRYEWHPVYQGLYDWQDGDVARETNCVHAAMVEMKLQGAADFWMIGEATVPLDGIVQIP